MASLMDTPDVATSAGHERVMARPDGAPVRVLVVDDEPTLTELLASVLRYEGWDIRTAADGTSAVRTAREFQPDAVVLDIMLPDFNGLEVLRRLRAEQPNVCVLFLTARDEVPDRVKGFALGADDYVTKPFSLEELVARIHAVLRRSPARFVADEGHLAYADLVMDEDTREVWRQGQRIELTATEFNLLHYMLSNARRVLSKSDILDHVWPYDFDGDPNIVETYVSYLRKKIDCFEPPLLHTVRGVGYSLRLPPEEQAL